MTTETFSYWLHGFFEISDSNTLTEKQVQIIKDHLALVFDKVTPDRTSVEDTEPVIKIDKKDLRKESNLWGIQTDTGSMPLCNTATKKHPFEELTRVVCSVAEIENEKDPIRKALKMEHTVYC